MESNHPRKIELDARNWRQADDLYSDLLAALGAPAWHGRNLDALWDSLTEAARYDVEINAIQPPFKIVVNHASASTDEARRLLEGIQRLLNAANEEFSLDLTIVLNDD